MAVRESNGDIKSVRPDPDKRGQAVLAAVIDEHFVTGEPVGSKKVAERFASSSRVSSATIRSVMSELEELGFLEQPHTSAGRVPTDHGYRFYVDNLLGVLKVSDVDLKRIAEEFGSFDDTIIEAPDRLLERTSQLLSDLSNNVGIVVSPSLANDRLQHIEFISVAENRVLVVMVSPPNIVHNRLIRLSAPLSREELEKCSNYLNAEFAGKSLSEIRDEILRRMHEERALFDRLLQTAVILCSQSIEGESESLGEVYVEGTTNILSKRDFADLERLRELLATIGEKSKLLHILNECVTKEETGKGEVKIVIGSENSVTPLQDCSLISAPYRIGDSTAVGTLSVLGPTRIEYARMIAVVSYLAKVLERLLAKQSA